MILCFILPPIKNTTPSLASTEPWSSMTPIWRLLHPSRAVVLFNTALSLHLQGRRDIRSRQTSFKKALWFYKLAVEILESSSDSNDGVNRLVYLAALNNMGHIYFHFFEGREAQHCIQLIQSMLETMKSSGTDICSNEYLPFYINVLILRGQEVAAAAAA
jgi:hypothetical protein